MSHTVKRLPPIRNLVLIGDSHVGCQLGLLHKDGARLDEGNLVQPSRLSRDDRGGWGHG